MKIFITTTEMLEAIFTAGVSADVQQMLVFAKEKDCIPVNVCSQMFLACNQGLDIMAFNYSTKDELMFRLGMALEKNNEYIISDGIVDLPAYVMDEYQIEVDKSKGAKVAAKSRTTKRAIGSSKAKSVKKSVKEVIATTEPVVEKSVVGQSEPVVEEPVMVSDNASVVPDVSTVLVDDVPVVESQGYSENVIAEFLKRSGVRACDMLNYNATDADLSNELLGILKADADKVRIAQELESKYGSQNATYVMKWIGSNLPKLHELANS